MTTILRSDIHRKPANMWSFLNNLRRWDSLVTRLIALVVVIGFLSLALHMAVMVSFAKFVSKGLTHATGNMVKHERALLIAAPAEKRLALAAKLSSPKHRIQRASNNKTIDESAAVESTFFNDPIMETLRREVGQDIRVSIKKHTQLFSPPNLITFSFDIDEQPWEIAYELESPYFVVLGSLLGWLILITLAIIVTSAVGVALVSRPLNHLSTQLSTLSRKPQALRIPNRSSREVRDVVNAFNYLIDINARAESTKQHMLAGVSHDLRTPLTRLRFRVEMTCDTKTAAEFSLDLDALERIVSQFLGYAQGETEVALGEPWSLNEVVSRIVSSYTMQGAPVLYKESDVSLTMPDLAIQRALTNMIDNALEYGRMPVEVELAETPHSAQDQVRMTVWDHGAGMTEEQFARARQPFSRLSGDAKASGHCGLGLAIVDQIAAQTGGRLELDYDKSSPPRFGLSIVWTK